MRIFGLEDIYKISVKREETTTKFKCLRPLKVTSSMDLILSCQLRRHCGSLNWVFWSSQTSPLPSPLLRVTHSSQQKCCKKICYVGTCIGGGRTWMPHMGT